jgi:hypothetical protein
MKTVELDWAMATSTFDMERPRPALAAGDYDMEKQTLTTDRQAKQCEPKKSWTSAFAFLRHNDGKNVPHDGEHEEGEIDIIWDTNDKSSQKKNRWDVSQQLADQQQQESMNTLSTSMSSNPHRSKTTLSISGSSAKKDRYTVVRMNKSLLEEVRSEPERSTVLSAEEAPPLVFSNVEKPVPKRQNSEYEGGVAKNVRLTKAAEERLNSLRELDDVRSSVDLWKEHKYCHRMFRHRAQSELAEQTCVEVWEKPES